jgi:hypothetical protein
LTIKNSKAYNSSNILYFIGDDFVDFDSKYYTAMDLAISYYNQNKCKNINLHYGVISNYFDKAKSR